MKTIKDYCEQCFYKTFVGRGESLGDYWCYMFRTNTFLFLQDYCGQFKTREDLEDISVASTK